MAWAIAHGVPDNNVRLGLLRGEEQISSTCALPDQFRPV